MLGVELSEFTNIELGLLDELDLSDNDIVEREHESALLLDGLADGVGDEGLDQLGQIALGGFLGQHLDHLPSDRLDLGTLGIRGLSDLVLVLLGEGDAKHPEDVAVLGLDLAVGLDEGLPLADVLAQLVSGDVHAVETGSAVAAINVFNPELDLSPRKKPMHKKRGVLGAFRWVTNRFAQIDFLNQRGTLPRLCPLFFQWRFLFETIKQ